MDISRRGILLVIGASLGSVGLAGASKMNNQTSTPSGGQNETEREDNGKENDQEDNEKENEQEGNEKENEQEDNENENETDDQNEQEDGETDDESESDSESEKNEKSFSQADVKLAPADAKQVATSEVSGSVSSLSLENHDGSPVYQVIVTPKSGAATQVTVDANTGTVLKTESAGED